MLAREFKKKLFSIETCLKGSLKKKLFSIETCLQGNLKKKYFLLKHVYKGIKKIICLDRRKLKKKKKFFH
jgi:hypothetical protein